MALADVVAGRAAQRAARLVGCAGAVAVCARGIDQLLGLGGGAALQVAPHPLLVPHQHLRAGQAGEERESWREDRKLAAAGTNPQQQQH
jgi:hypothetical protein